MTDKIVPVIMAGGKGTRLWPLSRATAAKQFLKMISDETLFQSTLCRVNDRAIYEAPLVITNEDFRFLVAEQAREQGVALSGIILEPVARNTAAAAAVAARIVADRFGDDALLLLLPSDHEISLDEAYIASICKAAQAAKAGKLVTFGITPTEPATGYGYIELGADLGNGVHNVNRFVEKPDAEKANALIENGNYYWNSGMFLFSAANIISEMEQFAPEVMQSAFMAVTNSKKDNDFIRLNAEAFANAPSISIDYAVMEKTTKAAVVPAAIHWSDMGSWDAVWKAGEVDENGNVLHGNVTIDKTQNSLVISRNSHMAVQGMDGIAVIASEDAVFVGRLDNAQAVGNLVKMLAGNKKTTNLTETHPTALRPWGGYTSILNGERFQVKRLFVHPGQKLSLQKHHHRAEHWICVKGAAEVTINDTVTILHENQSIYIPQGSVHRLGNPGKILLEMIEIQTGSYLGEDDIVRLVDEFGRA